MQTNIVFTLTGTDRVGIVEEVTRLFFDLGGNVETSRMVRLGGEFDMLMLVALPAEKLAGLQTHLQSLVVQGFKVTTQQTQPVRQPAGMPYHIQVIGADHEGIIHEVSQYLAEHGINIEALDTETSAAATSGTPLFSMKALVLVPPALQTQDWQAALDGIGQRLNVDVNVSSA